MSNVKDQARVRDHCRCQVWGCGCKDIHVHHIVFKSHRGPDELWNLICLCTNHHDQIHNREINMVDILTKISYRQDFAWSKALKILNGEVNADKNTGA